MSTLILQLTRQDIWINTLVKSKGLETPAGTQVRVWRVGVRVWNVWPHINPYLWPRVRVYPHYYWQVSPMMFAHDPWMYPSWVFNLWNPMYTLTHTCRLPWPVSRVQVSGGYRYRSSQSEYSCIDRSLYLYTHGSMDPLILIILHPQILWSQYLYIHGSTDPWIFESMDRWIFISLNAWIFISLYSCPCIFTCTDSQILQICRSPHIHIFASTDSQILQICRSPHIHIFASTDLQISFSDQAPLYNTFLILF